MAVIRQFGGERRAYRLFLFAEWLSDMVSQAQLRRPAGNAARVLPIRFRNKFKVQYKHRMELFGVLIDTGNRLSCAA